MQKHINSYIPVPPPSFLDLHPYKNTAHEFYIQTQAPAHSVPSVAVTPVSASRGPGRPPVSHRASGAYYLFIHSNQFFLHPNQTTMVCLMHHTHPVPISPFPQVFVGDKKYAWYAAQAFPLRLSPTKALSYIVRHASRGTGHPPASTPTVPFLRSRKRAVQ